MPKNIYSDNLTFGLIGPRTITLDSDSGTIALLSSAIGAVVVEAGTEYTTLFADGSPGSMTGSIQFNGTTVFEEAAMFNSTLRSEGNSFLRGSIVRLGASSIGDSISTIQLYPVGGVGGTPVHIQGDLNVEGTISGTLSVTDILFDDSDFIIDVPGGINLHAGGIIDIRNEDYGGWLSIKSTYTHLTAGSGNSDLYLYEDGRIGLHAKGPSSDDDTGGYAEPGFVYDSNEADLRIKFDDRAAFAFEAAWESESGDGASRYIVDIYNNHTEAGNHRCLRLSLAGDGAGESEPTSLNPSWGLGSGGNAGPGGDEAHQDYFLVCSDEVSDGTDGGVMELYIDGEGNVGITFTGQHWVVYENNSGEDMVRNECIGKIAYSSGEIFNKPKIDEALPVVKLCDTERDPRVYGVMTVIPKLAANMKQFLEFGKPYHESSKGDMGKDRSAYSSDSLYHKARVNSIGEGQVWVTNYNGEVSNGDYITSSAVAGYGMRQDDDILHNYTVAKCVEEIDWDSIGIFVDHEGTEYKKYLTACTYHCG